MRKIALFGAGGKMGQRLAANLSAREDYKTRFVEVQAAGRDALSERFGITCVSDDDAINGAEKVAIFAGYGVKDAHDVLVHAWELSAAATLRE